MSTNHFESGGRVEETGKLFVQKTKAKEKIQVAKNFAWFLVLLFKTLHGKLWHQNEDKAEGPVN